MKDSPLLHHGTLGCLRSLADALAPKRVVVIGAAALQHHLQTHRVTRDIDLAVATPLDPSVLPDGWVREAPPRQRWISPTHMAVDIVPVTPEGLERGSLEWPDGTTMSLIGLDLALRDSAPLVGGDPLRVASLCAIAVTKIVAWLERPGDRTKDLADLAVILNAYVTDADDRFHDDVDPAMDFDERAPFLLGRDIATRGTTQHVDVVERFVTKVLETPHLMSALEQEAAREVSWHKDGPRGRLSALRSGMAR